MTHLTPLEVRSKKGGFRRALGGYETDLVDDYVDLLADRLEQLVRQNIELSEAARVLREEVEEYRGRREALAEAVMSARLLRDDVRGQAERESGLLVREARLQAEDTRQEVARSLAHEEETLRQVRARRAEEMGAFRRLLHRELTELNVIEEALKLKWTVAGPEPYAELVEEPALVPLQSRTWEDEEDEEQVTVRPHLTNAPEVAQALDKVYPPMLREAGIGGTVKVWFYVDTDGRVTNTQINSSSGYEAFDQAALKVSDMMVFTPAYNGDKKVPVWVEMDLNFQQ
jgi:cell division initiation protein